MTRISQKIIFTDRDIGDVSDTIKGGISFRKVRRSPGLRSGLNSDEESSWRKRFQVPESWSNIDTPNSK